MYNCLNNKHNKNKIFLIYKLSENKKKNMRLIIRKMNNENKYRIKFYNENN